MVTHGLENFLTQQAQSFDLNLTGGIVKAHAQGGFGLSQFV
jgi:hypothetical protein